MGMYTELMLGVEFKSDTPKVVIDTIKWMSSDARLLPKEVVPDFISEQGHLLFKTDRWIWMLRSAGSYYFSAPPTFVGIDDDISKSYKFTLVTNIKNYTNEWELFLDYIAPHIDTDRTPFVGYMRYEEDTHPTLVYIIDGKPVFRHPETQVPDTSPYIKLPTISQRYE